MPYGEREGAISGRRCMGGGGGSGAGAVARSVLSVPLIGGGAGDPNSSTRSGDEKRFLRFTGTLNVR